MTTVLTSFDKWKEFLAERVENAKKGGMSNEVISGLAVHIGEFLSDKVDPKNEQERVLKELWDVGDENEKQAIARLMVKWMDKMK